MGNGDEVRDAQVFLRFPPYYDNRNRLPPVAPKMGPIIWIK